ncbi:hypothetical protein Droror1_Dr00004706 [Drosera rotundifolia]
MEAMSRKGERGCMSDPRTSSSTGRQNTRWVVPPSGKFNVNVDASFCNRERVGVATAVQDSCGRGCGAIGWCVHGRLSVEAGEALAVKAGVELAQCFKSILCPCLLFILLLFIDIF